MTAITMDTGEKQITLRDLTNAIRQNGVPQVRNEFFTLGEYDEGTDKYEVKGGCAIGQASINLGVDTGKLMSAFDKEFPMDVGKAPMISLTSYIIMLNDEKYRTLSEIADSVEQRWGEYLNNTVTVPIVDFSTGVPASVLESI